ncbi:MAG: hypothetical protein OK422_02435 [Thaumarchaeota archaeon]|nr:hypothetical protein [Nitrososphaerota archaeon]
MQVSNYVTKSKARVRADKNTSRDEFQRVLNLARASLAVTGFKSSKANLNGIVVELITNSDHQYEFWKNNWWTVETDLLPHARMYSVRDVNGIEPSAYYFPPTNTSVFVNTEYYGQCKSWALGMAAAILEKRFNTLSIHGASAMYRGKGVVIVAPTGTGKTTQSFKIFLSDEGKICGDDWVYVKFPENPNERPSEPLIARQPEKSLYMRSETQKDFEWLRPIFDRSLNENVVTKKEDCDHTEGEEMCKLTGKKCVFNDGFGWCYYAFGNTRSLVMREDLQGPEKVVQEVPVNLVVLLRRDDRSPAEVRLDSNQAIEILKNGEYQVLPGAGPKEMWGRMAFESWYNPYLLEPDDARQEFFFRSMFEKWGVPCVILNTGVEGVEETHKRIVSALDSVGRS